MQYLGGKHRQSKEIVNAIRRLRPNFRVYVEPFCGAMWSACAVIHAFPDRRYLFSDVHEPLMRSWHEFVINGLDPPEDISEKEYERYKRDRPQNDPLTGYVGFAMSFAAIYFAAFARDKRKKDSFAQTGRRTTLKKLEVLRKANVSLLTCDYRDAEPPPLGAMVYLDPPYEGRTHQHNGSKGFDYSHFRRWAEELSKRCCVITTEFVNPRGWEILHNWGDTVVRHHSGGESDGTCELLMRVRSKST